MTNTNTNFPRKKGGRPSKRPSNTELSFLYQSMTAQEVAEHYGVSVCTVRGWIVRARKEEQNNDN